MSTKQANKYALPEDINPIIRQRLYALKGQIRKNAQRTGLAPVQEGLLRVVVNDELDKLIGRAMRLRFLSWVFEREIKTTVLEHPTPPHIAQAAKETGGKIVMEGITNAEAFALIMWGQPTKNDDVWECMNPHWRGDVTRIAIAFKDTKGKKVKNGNENTGG